MNQWIIDNYQKLYQITDKLCSGKDTDELFQFCIEQFLYYPKIENIPVENRLFFFVRIVKNQYHSNTSKFHKIYRKHKFQELHNIEILDIPYEDSDELRWVYEQIEHDKIYGDWYYARLFEIYISEGCSMTNTHKRTTIPLNSVSRDVNKYRKQLIKRKKNKS